MSLRRLLLAGFVVAALSPAAAIASPFTIVSSVGGAPTGVVKENFDGLTVGGASGQVTGTDITVNFQPNAAIVKNSLAGVYAAPSLSGGNGLGFGSPNQPNGANTTPYLTSGSTGAPGFDNAAIELVLPFDVLYMGLLWGSIDNYNTLTFYNGVDLVGTITGSDVSPLPNGDQGPDGTRYVNINSTVAFNRVVATSTSFAFEFDNVAFNDTPIIIEVPEPTTLLILGAGLLGLGAVRRRRNAA